MGTGDVDASSTAAAANALWVTNSDASVIPTSVRDNFTAWPPPGYVPCQVAFARWSFQPFIVRSQTLDMSAATVTMQSGGQVIPVNTEPLLNNDSPLVWEPSGYVFRPDQALSQDQIYQVTVNNVIIDGITHSFTYQVTVFDPNQIDPAQVLPVLGGLTAIPVGTPSVFQFSAVPSADDYRWMQRSVVPLALLDNAENGIGDVTIYPAGTNLLASVAGQTGNGCYQFESTASESMTLNPTIIPVLGGTLQFNSKLGLATSYETASAQISTDGGNSWRNLYQLSGINDVTENNFSAHLIDLSAYAGQVCTIRFIYALADEPGAGAYPGTDDTWSVDDIRVTGAQTFAGESATFDTAGATNFALTPATAGVYALQVTPLFFGPYPAYSGPLTLVKAGFDAAVPVPVITSAGLAVGQAGSPFNYQIAASTAAASYTASGLPAGLTLNPASGLISGTAATGDYVVILGVSNAGGIGSAAVELLFGTAAPAPTPNPTPTLSPTLAPVLTGGTITGEMGSPFSFQITATNHPTSYAVSGLPSGLNLNVTNGLITGSPTVTGTFTIGLTATNAAGTGGATLSLTIQAPLPTVSLVVTTPVVVAGTENLGEFTLNLSAAQTYDVVVNLTIKGTATNGTDYVLLKTTKKIKAGKTSKPIKIIPQGDLGGLSKKTVVLTLQSGNGYMVGTTGKVKVKILAP